jgi:hypothetical protein
MKEALATRPSVGEIRSSLIANHEKPLLIFLSGMGGTQKDLDSEYGIRKAYEREYDEGNVITVRGAISSDHRDPRRDFKMVADTIVSQASKRPIHLVMHSIGTTSFMYIKKIIEKMNKKFFHDPQIMNNLQLLKIGESGSSRGPISRIKYIWNVLRLNRRKDIKTHYAFPVKEVKPSVITTVFAKKSNKYSEYETISNENPASHDDFLTPQEKAAKETTDTEFRSAVASMDYARARRVSKERGNILRRPLQAVFEGSPSSAATKRRLKLGGFRGLRILFRAIGSKPMREIRRLLRMGYRVPSLVSEFEEIVKPKQAAWIYKDKMEASENIRIMEGSSHDGVALQAEEWAKASIRMFDLAA